MPPSVPGACAEVGQGDGGLGRVRPARGQVPGAGVRTIGCDGLRINQVDDVMSINSLHL
jgi:hypothetical protein